MSGGGLTEEQRQRIEANRQKALQKKNQRQQLQSNSAPIGPVVDYNEVNNSSHAVAKFDYNEAPSNNNQSARESFGDSNIDWNEVIQLENQRQSNTTVSNLANKRKLEPTMHTASDVQSKRAPLDENNYQLNSLLDRHSTINNKAAAPSTLTEEQRLRIEQNRLRALEKKKKIASNSTEVQQSTSIEINRLQVPERIKHTSNYDGATTTTLTDDQRALVEQKRQFALLKKQSLSMNNSHATTKAHTSAANTDQSQSKPSYALSGEQRTQIEQKRPAALQKKQSGLNATTSSSHSQYLNDQYFGRQQNNAFASLSNINESLTAANTTCTMATQPQEQSSSMVPSNHSSLTNEQKDLIEKKRLAALQKKQAKEASRNVQCNATGEQNLTELKVSHNPLSNTDSDTVVRNAQQEQFEAARAATAPQPNTKIIEPLSPTKNKRKESELPRIPTDLQYEQSRCLPIVDGFSDSLIENAELDEPLLNGWSLYDHQKEGILRALQMRRLILAFDMGLGAYCQTTDG
jgi:hypothetical protein